MCIRDRTKTSQESAREAFEGWRKILEKVGLDPEHAQRFRRSSDKRARTEDGFEPSSAAMASMDWRITVPGLTMLLTCFTISGRYQKDMGDAGKTRLQALLQGCVDNVVRPNGGIYVLGAGEAAVSISDGNVMLDMLMSNQAADGVHVKSRTLLSMHVCLCIDDVLLAELHQLVAWPCDMAECALICTHALARIGSGLETPVTLIQFLEYLGGYILGGRTTTAFRDRAALYMRSVCLGIGRLHFLSQREGSWAASSLAMLGSPLGPQGKRRRLTPGLKKELVETTQSLRGRGVSKVSSIALGYEMVQHGGACETRAKPRGPVPAE